MKNNLVERYNKALPGELEAQEVLGFTTIAFLQSIEGKEVELVFTAGDAFEKENNNIWLPDSLWIKVKGD